MVTLGSNVKVPTDLQLMPLAVILNKIKSDQNLKQLVEKIRSIDDKKERQDFKQTNLPYLCLSQFKKSRSKENFISTEAMVFDADHLEDVEVIIKYIKKWKYTSAVFISPSGNGLKIIVKLARPITNNDEYTLVYETIASIIETELNLTLDRSTKDSSRTCFLSYDPDIYINEEAEAFNPDDEANSLSTIKKASTALSKSQEIQRILGGVEEGERYNSMLKLIGAYKKQNHSKEEILKLLIGWNVLNQPPIDDNELKSEFERAYKSFDKPNDNKIFYFWYLDPKRGVIIEDDKFINFLEDQGFYKIKYGLETYELIKLDQHVIRNTSIVEIQEYVKKYIENINIDDYEKESVLDKVIKSVKNLFSQQTLNFLETLEPEIANDTKDKALLFFNDKFIEITAQGIQTKSYADLNGRFIWQDDIMGIDTGDISLNDSFNNSEFDALLRNITKNDHEWYEALASSIGYMLHNYKDPANAKAIIFCDEEIPTSSEANGGTGKSLCCSALNHLKKCTVIDGKNYKADSQFNFQKITIDTKVVIIDDVRKSFDFESLLSAITSDLVIEKKFKDQITIPYKDAPKFIITTNYTINGNGNSYERRKHEIEFSNHYNKHNTPDKEFGHRFFDDWVKDEWNSFYSSMINYIQFYLKYGLKIYTVKNLPVRRIINSTCQEFLDFMDDKVELNREYNKSDLFNDFKKDFTDPNLTSQKFTGWLKIYADNLSLTLISRRSNSKHLIAFLNKPDELDELPLAASESPTEENQILMPRVIDLSRKFN